MISLEIPKTDQENNLLCKWVEQRIPNAHFKNFTCMAFFDDTKGILAVVLYHNYRGTDIEVVFASDDKRWAQRDLLGMALRYPFTIGCHRITALATKQNKKVRKLLTQIGFKQEGKLRRAAKDKGDYFIYGLLPDEYRMGRKKQLKKAA